MVPESSFIVKLNTRTKKIVWKYHLSTHNLWQDYQIAIIDVSIDRATHYFCNEELDHGSGRHFYSEIQHPA